MIDRTRRARVGARQYAAGVGLCCALGVQASPLCAAETAPFIDSRDGDATNFAVPSRLSGAVRIWTYIRPDAASALEVWEVPPPQRVPVSAPPR